MNNYHQSARTTFCNRASILKRVVKQGMSASEVAERLGISSCTVYKWLVRYRAGDAAVLHKRTSRPNRSPRGLPVGRAATIAAMRRMHMTSPAIAFALSPPLSTESPELRRLGLNRMPRLEAKPPVVRYEHEKPGDMIHLDIKKLSRIDGVGHRFTGDRSYDPSRQSEHIGPDN